jgi:hypothetical protein
MEPTSSPARLLSNLRSSANQSGNLIVSGQALTNQFAEEKFKKRLLNNKHHTQNFMHPKNALSAARP